MTKICDKKSEYRCLEYLTYKQEEEEKCNLTNLQTMSEKVFKSNKLTPLYEDIRDELGAVEKKISRIASLAGGEGGDCMKTAEIYDYFFKIPGKKLRPALALFSACAVNGGRLAADQQEDCVDFAAAIELIHSASLIHDDIIDNDAVRRGRQSVSRRFGTQSAVLFGDMLYAEAFLLLSNLNNGDQNLKNSIIRMVSGMSREMCVGEIEEIRYSNRYTFEQYKSVIEKKTASLTEVSCRCPAMMLGRNEQEVNALGNYGYNFGMLYQVLDDTNDGDVEVSGMDPGAYIYSLACEARESIAYLQESSFKRKMCEFIKYLKEE